MKPKILLLAALMLAGCQSTKQDAPAAISARPQAAPSAAAPLPAGGEPVHSLAADEAMPVLKPVKLTAAQSDVVKMGVANKTKNMETAAFGPMTGGAGADGVITVCGLVDSDNGAGGMTGMQPFVGVLSGPAKNPTDFVVANIGDGGDVSQAIRNICLRQGTPIPG